MRPQVSRAFAASLVSVFLCLSGFSREIVDSTGARVVVKDHVERIITLAPSLGELAADLLSENLQKIVGVSEYSNYPPALKRVTSVGPYSRFNLEQVVTLRPDLVLATTDGNSKDQILHLRELGIAVVVVSTGTLKQMQESIQLVALAMGESRRGAEMADQLRKGIDRISLRAAGRTKKRVLLQIGDDPLIVVGRESFLHEAIELIGAKNVYHDAKAHYPRPSVEDVVRRDPDTIMILAMGGDLRPFYLMAKKWEQFPLMNAVKNKRIFVLSGDSILRPTLRLLEGLAQLERVVYGQK